MSWNFLEGEVFVYVSFRIATMYTCPPSISSRARSSEIGGVIDRLGTASAGATRNERNQANDKQQQEQQTTDNPSYGGDPYYGSPDAHG
jgi:hypothetical protein